MVEFLIGLFVIIGVGYTSFQIGVRKGTETCLALLVLDKIITIDSNSIRPNYDSFISKFNTAFNEMILTEQNNENQKGEQDQSP